jgi:predicted RNA-binding protein YlxR (DUF448 family)
VRPAEPQRRCVGCRKAKPQAALLRLTAQGPGRSNPGRGCYLCRDERCARAALKTGQIGRALKGKVAELSLDRLLGWMDLSLA